MQQMTIYEHISYRDAREEMQGIPLPPRLVAKNTSQPERRSRKPCLLRSRGWEIMGEDIA